MPILTGTMSRAPRLLAGAALGLLLTTLFASYRLTAQAQPRELYVSAFDDKKMLVKELSPSDLIVREDGVRREVLRIRPATAPMQIALLVDNTAASERATVDFRNAVTSFIDAMADRNEIALITFADRPTILVNYTKSREELRKGVGLLFPQSGSGSYFLDAITEVTRGIGRREADRPVIVTLITDGNELSNAHHVELLKQLQVSGASLHVLTLTYDVTSDTATDENRERASLVALGTEQSGGRRDNLLASTAFPNALKDLAAELSNQFVVEYARPQTLIPPEKIEVTPAKSGWTVRATPIRTRK